jgi:hypothetical protein
MQHARDVSFRCVDDEVLAIGPARAQQQPRPVGDHPVRVLGARERPADDDRACAVHLVQAGGFRHAEHPGCRRVGRDVVGFGEEPDADAVGMGPEDDGKAVMHARASCHGSLRLSGDRSASTRKEPLSVAEAATKMVDRKV